MRIFLLVAFWSTAAAASVIAPQSHSIDGRRGIAVSPDGAWVAFVVTGVEGDRLAIASTSDATNIRVLDHTAGAQRPFWAPNGDQIAYFTTADLQAVPADGGKPVTLCKCEGVSGTWSARGILFAPRRAGPLQMLDVRHGTVRAATTLPNGREYAHDWPRFMPAGDQFLYIAHIAGDAEVAPRSDLYLSDFSNHRQLIATDVTDAAPVDAAHVVVQRADLHVSLIDLTRGDARPLSPEVQFDAYDANGAGAYAYHVYGMLRSQLVRVNRDGSERKELTVVGEIRRPRLSRDGKLVAYQDGSDLVVIGIDDGHELGRLRTIPFGGAAWSPDGTRVAAPMVIDGQCQVAILSFADGKITPLTNCAPVFDWSPDGRYIVLDLADGMRHDFRFVTLDGKSEDRRYFKDRVEGWLRFAPDGSAVAIDAKKAIGLEHAWLSVEGYVVFVVPIDTDGNATSAPVAVAATPSYRPSWSGKDLFFVGREHRLFCREATSPPRVLEVTPLSLSDISFGDYDVTPDGRTFVIVQTRDVIDFVRQ